MKIEELEVESRWYIKLPGGTALVEREIVEVTECTVLLRDPRCVVCNAIRYIFDELVFVEAC